MTSMYAQLREEGLCPACAKRPPAAGKSYCIRCLKNLAGQKRRHRQRRGGEWKAHHRAEMREWRKKQAKKPPASPTVPVDTQQGYSLNLEREALLARLAALQHAIPSA